MRQGRTDVRQQDLCARRQRGDAGDGFGAVADTTAYAAGDLVANSTTAGAVTPLELFGATRAAGEAVRIQRVRLRKTGVGLTNAAFRVHLFRKPPVVRVGNNAAFNASGVLALADNEGHVGAVDLVMDTAAAIGARGAGLPSSGSACAQSRKRSDADASSIETSEETDMAAQRGKDILLKIGDGANPQGFTRVAGLRARTISLNAKTIDHTDGDSAGRWRELLSARCA